MVMKPAYTHHCWLRVPAAVRSPPHRLRSQQSSILHGSGSRTVCLSPGHVPIKTSRADVSPPRRRHARSTLQDVALDSSCRQYGRTSRRSRTGVGARGGGSGGYAPAQASQCDGGRRPLPPHGRNHTSASADIQLDRSPADTKFGISVYLSLSISRGTADVSATVIGNAAPPSLVVRGTLAGPPDLLDDHGAYSMRPAREVRPDVRYANIEPPRAPGSRDWHAASSAVDRSRLPRLPYFGLMDADGQHNWAVGDGIAEILASPDRSRFQLSATVCRGVHRSDLSTVSGDISSGRLSLYHCAASAAR